MRNDGSNLRDNDFVIGNAYAKHGATMPMLRQLCRAWRIWGGEDLRTRRLEPNHDSTSTSLTLQRTIARPTATHDLPLHIGT